MILLIMNKQTAKRGTGCKIHLQLQHQLTGMCPHSSKQARQYLWLINHVTLFSVSRQTKRFNNYMQNTTKHQILMWQLRAHQTDNTQVFQSIGCHRKCSLQWLGRSSLILLPILMIENSHYNNISQTAKRQLMPSPVQAQNVLLHCRDAARRDKVLCV